ncbi:MAG: class I SAM-dependent methyltransferase [Parcubacteria group bacterium]|nr:class I SAM-dependent methyltransferase [Parcubacteria group bacterium]
MAYQNKNLKYIDATAYDKRGESSILEKYVLGLWQPFLKNKIGKLSADKIIVDWGCGTGEYALAAKMAKKIYCIDISDIMLAGAREKLKSFDKIEFILGSGFNKEIPGGIGELVLTIGVWEYVDPIKLFEEIKRLTKRSSLVLVVFPNIYNDLNWMRSIVKIKKSMPTSRQVALWPGFIKNLFKQDFKLVESASFGNVSFAPKRMQFLALPVWKFCDWLWMPFQKFLPLGINVYYLFERK